jgi:hypothetical protein
MPLSLLRRVLLAAIVSRSPRTRIAGVSVVDFSEHERPDTLFAALEEALRILGDRHPWRLTQVQRAFRHVLIIPAGGQAYAVDTNCCLIDLAALEVFSPARLAACLVHESIHARLHRARVRHTPERLDRIEHLCIRHQMAVLQSFPSTEDEAQQLREAASERWWQPPHMRARRREQLRGFLFPEWLITLHARLWR